MSPLKTMPQNKFLLYQNSKMQLTRRSQLFTARKIPSSMLKKGKSLKSI
jgi:hypothetical protein